MSPDPMTLLREADPAGDERPDPVESEALLRRVLAQPVAPPRSRRRLALRLAPVAAAVLALVAVALVAWPRAGAVERAYAAMTPSEGTILHVVSESGFARGEQAGRGMRTETWSTDDGRTHVISNPLGLSAGPSREIAATPTESRAYSFAYSSATGISNERIEVIPSAEGESRIGTAVERFREDVRAGRVKEAGTARVGDRTLTRFAGADDRVTYLVDPQTDELVLERRPASSGFVRETRILIVEELPLTARTEDLLELGPHPGVPVVRRTP